MLYWFQAYNIQQSSASTVVMYVIHYPILLKLAVVLVSHCFNFFRISIFLCFFPPQSIHFFIEV